MIPEDGDCDLKLLRIFNVNFLGERETLNNFSDSDLHTECVNHEIIR